jgi:hypothetical protein
MWFLRYSIRCTPIFSVVDRDKSCESEAGMSPPPKLHLDILPSSQRRLWDELHALPPEFVLYGGTAVALQLGHRQSVDFDLFSNRSFDSQKLDLDLPFLRGATVTQRAPNSLSAVVDRDGPVKLSFFGVPKLPRLLPPLTAPDNDVRIASLLDLAGTKLSVVQMRAEPKDYLDIDAIHHDGGLNIEAGLASGSALYGPTFNPQTALKALVYFEDETLRDLPQTVKKRLVQLAKAANLDQLPSMPVPHYCPPP